MKMAQIDVLSEWSDNLGLLPVNLHLDQHNENQFILLDGFKGDFCLELHNEEQTASEYKSSAWSCNARNFVTVESSEVKIYNWLKAECEIASRSAVQSNLGRFYNYLTSDSTPTSNDVVSFVLSIYRKLRNMTDEAEADATRSIDLLFLILAAHEENVAPNQIDSEKWGLMLSEVPEDLNPYLEEFSRGFSETIKPKTGLILRHASGLLFEETAKAVSAFDKSGSLFDHTYSSVYQASPSPYSSVHYTPAFLARSVVENSIRFLDFGTKNNLTIFDPACGSSEFLMEVLKQLKTLDYQGTIRVIGWDASTAGIHTSKFLLSYEKREWNDRLTIDVRQVEDSLTLHWPEGCEIVLMNLPFHSGEQMDEGQRAVTRNVLGSNFQKRPNQASAFLYKATLALSTDGILGTVLPSSILTLDSYGKLRQFLTDNLNVRLVGKLGNFLFTNAMTDVSILVGHPKAQEADTTLLWTDNRKGVASDAIRGLRRFHSGNLKPVSSPDFSVYSIGSDLEKLPDWKISSHSEFETREWVEGEVEGKRLTRIKFVFEVKQGIRTGNNNVFKMGLRDYHLLPENERKYFRPVVDNKAIRNGKLTISGYIWFPYDADGMLLHDEAKLVTEVPEFYRSRLKSNEEALRGRALGENARWWELTRHRSWLLQSEQRLVSTEFGRSDSFAFDEYGEFVVERGYGWIFKTTPDSNDAYHYYLAIFSSKFFDRLLSIYSRQLAGGDWYDLGSKFTKDIPIPRYGRPSRPNDLDIVSLGLRISAGEQIDALELNKKVLECYGIAN
mgnify:CR=1 FL=1